MSADPSSPNTVHVVFINDEDGETFAETDLPLEQLPESFEADTTLNLGPEDWSVISAEPMTAAEIADTGTLTLRLRKVEIGFLSEDETIYYSIPTINDGIAPIEKDSSKLNLNTLEILEDDWRQVEWISERHRGHIDEMLEAIRAIYENEREEDLFMEMHVREEPSRPLDTAAIRWCDLKTLLDEVGEWYDGLSYAGIAGTIRDGFAINCSDLNIYGRTQGEYVSELCIRGGSATPPEPVLRIIKTIMQDYRLYLVNWCRAQLVEADNVETLFDSDEA